MWPFRPKATRPIPVANLGPVSFPDWTEADIDRVSKAIRWHGQPESDGFRTVARVALNTLAGRRAVELVARAIEESENPRLNPDRPVPESHYMHGMPHWCVWIEYAKPAVDEIVRRSAVSQDERQQ